jgi:hypothetical protein
MPSLCISISDTYRTLGRMGIRRYWRYVLEVSGIDRKTIREVYARARGSPMEAPAVGFYNTTPPPIEAELRRRCGYIYIEGTLNV